MTPLYTLRLCADLVTHLMDFAATDTAASTTSSIENNKQSKCHRLISWWKKAKVSCSSWTLKNYVMMPHCCHHKLLKHYTFYSLAREISPIQMSNAGPRHNNGTDAKGVLIQACAVQNRWICEARALRAIRHPSMMFLRIDQHFLSSSSAFLQEYRA